MLNLVQGVLIEFIYGVDTKINKYILVFGVLPSSI